MSIKQFKERAAAVLKHGSVAAKGLQSGKLLRIHRRILTQKNFCGYYFCLCIF